MVVVVVFLFLFLYLFLMLLLSLSAVSRHLEKMNQEHVVEFCGALERNTTLQILSFCSCMSFTFFLRSHFCFCLLTLFNHQALV